ncbi:MAG: OmpA family protein [Candidatus Cryptobacteroides sp.]
MKKVSIIIATCIMVLAPTSCGTLKSLNNAQKDALIGTGAGAAIGAGIGALIGKDGKGAAIGAAIGSAVGAGTGAVIGKKMDEKAAALAQEMENAQVETITDANGLQAIKVTFESGILFPTNGTSLSVEAKNQLATFSTQMKDLQDTDITIFGHTDNTGSASVNERISLQRAESVASYLQSRGINASRIHYEGRSFNDPVADNDTAEGRAKNRRVEVYVTANENMIKAAENGNL